MRISCVASGFLWNFGSGIGTGFGMGALPRVDLDGFGLRFEALLYLDQDHFSPFHILVGVEVWKGSSWCTYLGWGRKTN
jgi:hypothetical protein